MDEQIGRDLARIEADLRYRALVRRKQRFAWVLTAITVGAYTGFISLIAFGKPLMAQTIGDGTITLAVVLGAAMLVGTVAICTVYVLRANGAQDEEMAAILADGVR